MAQCGLDETKFRVGKTILFLLNYELLDQLDKLREVKIIEHVIRLQSLMRMTFDLKARSRDITRHHALHPKHSGLLHPQHPKEIFPGGAREIPSCTPTLLKIACTRRLSLCRMGGQKEASFQMALRMHRHPAHKSARPSYTHTHRTSTPCILHAPCVLHSPRTPRTHDVCSQRTHAVCTARRMACVLHTTCRYVCRYA